MEPRCMGQKVWARADGQTVTLDTADDTRIADYARGARSTRRWSMPACRCSRLTAKERASFRGSSRYPAPASRRHRDGLERAMSRVL